jgi:hypothetical protein
MLTKMMTSKTYGRLLYAVALAAGLGAMPAVHADGQIFLCTDANGNKELTDTRRNAKCKQLDLPGAITAPPARPATTRQAAPVSTPEGFPKVDQAQQKARDDDRRQILTDELRAEQQKLAEQQKVYKDGTPDRNGNERNYAKYQERVVQMKEDITRTEKNIEALQREIANIK